MFERLKAIYERFLALEKLVSDPQVIANQNEWRKLVKEHSDLSKIVDEYLVYLRMHEAFEECKDILTNSDDAELRELAKDEYRDLQTNEDESLKRLKILLLPVDPNDDKNVIIEIRAGAGGEEAGLFGTELMRMYHLYADRNRWSFEEINMNMTDLGGVKEVVFMLSGNDAYSKLKFESGVHRVQRVPETESQGRVHTSTVTVAVLPEVEDVQVELNEKDIKIDTYRSSGAGGQHVNKTESAIRMTHLPTGIIVECQDERSQIKNREKAMRVLRSRLYEYYQSQATEAYAENRKTQVGTGDRSERIRTYNYPQGRVSDHRIGLTLYSLPAFLNGDLDEMIEALQLANQMKLLEGEKNE